MTDLPQVLEDVARALQDAPGPQQTLEAVSAAAVDVIGGAEHAGVSLVLDRRDVESVAATSELVREVDRAQYATGEGPCLDALYESAVVRMDDDEAEQRWPAFTGLIRGQGIRSMMAFRLFLAGDDAAALNLYSAQRDAFDDEALELGRMLATHAAVALAGARKVEQLEHAVATRDVIGQAKGILMERHDLDAATAFQVLARGSQEANIKLVEVARRVVRRD